MKVVFACLSALLLVALSCVSLWAQATAQISGTVKDQTGAVLPGVEITATHTDTGIARTTVTNETGSYVLPNLVTGPYRVEASLPGFRTFVQTGVVLQVNSSPVINPILEIGQVSEQVEVQANAALVETRSVGVGQVIENQRILELPLNGRLITDLITLSGAAVTTAVSSGRTFNDLPFISVGGGLGYGTDYSLDGANHMNFLIGTTMPMPFPDATQEFKVESTGLSANRGNSSSVAVVTKSGTNEIHGDLFEFVRNDLFNARNYFARTHSTLKRNQYGGTIGGPIIKNRVFFFGGYQGYKQRQDPADSQAFIATPAMLAGDWTAFTSAACNAGVARVLRAPFANNRIDPAQYSKVAVFVANKVLASQNAPPSECGLVTFGAPVQRNDGLYTGKVDYQRSAQHSIFGRVLFNSQYQPDSGQLTQNLLANVAGTDALASSYVLGDTYLIGTNTVQAFRLAVNRIGNHQLSKQYFSVCDAGATDIYCGYTPKWLSGWTITGGFGGLGIPVPTGTYWNTTQYQLNDDVSMVHGTHQLIFGLGATHGRVSELANFLSGGSFAFTGNLTGLGMGDFMTGKVTTFQQSTPNKNDVHETRINLYATDSWKVTSRVTASYGIRWEPFLPQLIPDWGNVPGPIYNFSHDRFIKGIYSSVFTNAPAGFYYTGDPGFPPRTGVDKKWLQFSPRLGFAWDVTGDGRMSARASFAYGYAFLPGLWREDTAGSNPWGGRVSVSNPPGGLDAPWRGLVNPFPNVLNKDVQFPLRGLFKSDPQNLTTPQTYSWNLSLQRQIAGSWVVSGSYIATRTLHIWTMNPINPAIFLGLGPCTLDSVAYATCSATTNTDARRQLSLERPRDGDKIGPLGQMDAGATSVYHGLLLSAEKRAARGLTLSTNYTLSHCISPYMGSQIFKLAPDATYTKPNDRDFDRGNCDSDRRHLLNLTALVQTPTFSNVRLRQLATGWRFSSIYRISSGQPLDVVSGVDRALTGVAVTGNTTNLQRPDQILGSGYKDTSAGPMTQWLNPAAFALPTMGTYGNVGWNSLNGPRSWSFDMSLSRSFNLREMQRLEVRAEAFNVTNSFRPGNPNATLSSNVFGQIRTALDPRIMQFALKYVF
jgi:carboxypeptidase family protein